MITWDASGDPAAVAAGTSGHFLKSQGAGSVPVFAADNKGAWNLIGTSVASGSSDHTITGLDSTYDTYCIALSDVVPATDAVRGYLRVGDSSGIDTGASDYGWVVPSWHIEGTTRTDEEEDKTDSFIEITNPETETVGSASGEGFGCIMYLHRPADGTTKPNISGHGMQYRAPGTDGEASGYLIFGTRFAVITLDRIQFYFSSGNVATGRMTVWGLAHT